MDYFEDNLGKEVFILSEEKKNDCTLTFHKKPEEVSSYFNSSIARSIYDVSLYHGILTKAISIPSEISTNIDILVIVRKDKSKNCNIFPCVSLNHAQTLISALVGSSVSIDNHYLDTILEDISGLDKQNIDNIYIMYGYTIELHYSFDKNELDAEIIAGSKEIYAGISTKQ